MPCTLILHPHLFFTPLSMPLRIPISCPRLHVSLFIQWTLWSQILFWWTWVVSFGAKQREHWSFNGVCAVIMCLLIENYILELVFPSNLMQVGRWQTKPVNESASYKFTWSYCEDKLHHLSWRHANTSPKCKEERLEAGKHSGMARRGSYELYLESRAKNNGGK